MTENAQNTLTNQLALTTAEVQRITSKVGIGEGIGGVGRSDRAYEHHAVARRQQNCADIEVTLPARKRDRVNWNEPGLTGFLQDGSLELLKGRALTRTVVTVSPDRQIHLA